ncbi:MAG: 2-oxoacid:acceptor oxidoreductase subunit alpha, partial [Sulfobacillus sp.]|nr:2-oxoacid:acceptor oxidoreductase subunit alpha [Sulfobacillus sp.]
ARVPEVLVVEQNATGQLSLIMREAGVWEASRFHSVLKFDGVPFFPEEIMEAARPWLARVEVTR